MKQRATSFLRDIYSAFVFRDFHGKPRPLRPLPRSVCSPWCPAPALLYPNDAKLSIRGCARCGSTSDDLYLCERCVRVFCSEGTCIRSEN